jgi:para-aminobenzoate synthetase component 1
MSHLDSTEINLNKSLPWQQDTFELSETHVSLILRKLRNPVYLDSNDYDNSCFNIISGEPLDTFYSDNQSARESLSAIEKLERQARAIPHPPKSIQDIPFSSGLLGFVSYDFGEHLILDKEVENINRNSRQTIPSLFIGLFTWSLVNANHTNKYYLTFSPQCNASTRAKVQSIIKLSIASSNEPQKLSPYSLQWRKSASESSYTNNLTKIKSYINEGDCYQVNYAQQFQSESDIDSLDYYMALRDKTRTPYSCFMELGPNKYLLSFSPEQFIGIDQRRVETKPIKGTIENDIQSDNAEILTNSEKDRAENLMIVDLLRNDLSKVCQLNTVKVDKLFSLESFKNVHHLVSHISGILKPDISELSAFLECFPGGSITGAPKKRAMEIIRELESSPRGAYCGSVFYLNYNGKFDSNILIRTIIKSGKNIECWGGGGITADSQIDSEYKESLVKVANLTGLTN